MKTNVIISSVVFIFLSVILSPIAALAGNTLAGNYLASQFARENGDVDDAIAALAGVRQEEPKDVTVASQLQGLLLLKGDVDGAIKLAADIRKMDDKDQLSDLLLALREIKNNDPDNARKMLGPVFDSDSEQLWLPLISAWLDIGKGKLAKPMTAAELSSGTSRATPLINYHLALINAEGGFTDAAALNFKNAIEDPSDPPTRVMAMLLTFYRQNHSPAVLTPVVEAFYKTHPEEKNSKDVSAITTMRDGVAEVLYTMGGIMLGAEADDDATIYLQMALYTRPDFSEAALSLGDAYSELKQYDRADDAYGRVAQDNSLYEQAQLHIVANYEKLDKVDQGLAMLDTLAKRYPDNPDALITKGDLLRMHSRYREALQAYSDALERIPHPGNAYWPVLFARGTCYERLGNWAAAERDLEQALVFKPDQPDVLNYLGYGWMEHSEKLADARTLIEKAVKQRPDSGEIIDSMGWALYLSRDYAGAVNYLEKAVELMPTDATVNDHLGDAYWRLGHKTDARYQWERSLSSSPDPKMADDLRRKLKEGLLPPSPLPDNSIGKSASATP